MEKNLREYTKLAKTSIQIMLAAVDNFNRVFSNYKTQTTFILLTNAWELISKAILLKKRKNIYRDKSKKITIAAEEAVLKLYNDKILTENQIDLLNQIFSIRNYCVHNICPEIPIEINHHLFYFACKFYKDLIIKFFPKYKKEIETNFISISFNETLTYADKVKKIVSKIKTTNNKNNKELVWLLERGICYKTASSFISQAEFEKKYKNKKRILSNLELNKYLNTTDMVRIVPVQAPKNYSADIILRKGDKKLTNSLPVIYKKSNVNDDYPFLTSDIAKKISKNRNYTAKLISKLKLKGNEEYHYPVKSSKNGCIHKYSENALSFIKGFLENNPDYNPYS